MKKILPVFLLILLSVFSFWSCADDDEGGIDEKGSLEVKVLLTYEDEPLVMQQDYMYNEDLPVRFTKVNFFLSELELENELKEEIHFLDFSRLTDLESAQAGLSFSIDDLDAKVYDKFSFSIGVPGGLNGTLPSDYSSDHPLAQVSEHWPGWNSYIFAKFEGLLADDGTTFDKGYSFHTGTDELYRTFTTQNIEIKAGQTSVLTISMDVEKVFAGDGSAEDFINLREVQGAHNEGALDIMKLISDNYANALTLNLSVPN